MTVTEKLPGQAGKSGESAGNEVSLRLPWLCVWMWCQGGDGQFFRVLPGMRARVLNAAAHPVCCVDAS